MPERGIVNRARMSRDDVLLLFYLVLPLEFFLLAGTARGWLEYVLRPRARRAVRGNLRDLLPADTPARTVGAATRRFFRFHQRRHVLLTLAPLMRARGELGRILSFEGLDVLERALAAGRGVILLGSHVHSASMLTALMELRRRGLDVRVAFPAQESPWAPSAVRRWLLGRYGALTLVDAAGAFHTQFNVRPLVSVLRTGAALLLLGDGWHAASFSEVELFGQRLPLTTGPLALARLTGVPVVPMFVTGIPGRQRVIFEEAFTVEGSAADGGTERALQHYARRLEHYVGLDVACWQHVEEANLLDHLRGWRDRSLAERYQV